MADRSGVWKRGRQKSLNMLINIQMSKIDVGSFEPEKAVRLWESKNRRKKARLFQDYTPKY
ncbi:hypothetical protein DPMN_133550 [Dreissena polymorpha]|uniref:Uncharacterized protein n=1 Tax=Dreissena polymorpha TaxID=45954 RepID=A0A9D4FUJ5_DREPO|nr:hypothetical protein DPMN_133550 [Dreissena polymorpha]